MKMEKKCVIVHEQAMNIELSRGEAQILVELIQMGLLNRSVKEWSHGHLMIANDIVNEVENITWPKE